MTDLFASSKAPVAEIEISRGKSSSYHARVILFNDSIHTFDEVARQLVKAIRCTYSKGMTLAYLVDSQGSTVVYSGHWERCEAVASVLEEIRLRVKVER
jgi:ATP-dependent Clp protease adapter protein ClpS